MLQMDIEWAFLHAVSENQLGSVCISLTAAFQDLFPAAEAYSSFSLQEDTSFLPQKSLTSARSHPSHSGDCGIPHSLSSASQLRMQSREDRRKKAGKGQ